MLKSMLPAISKKMVPLVHEALKVGGDAVAAGARDRVPVDSGKLREAIHVDPNLLAVRVVAGDNDAWYGHLVEHGTARIPARPFLVPALESNRHTIVELTAAALRRL